MSLTDTQVQSISVGQAGTINVPVDPSQIAAAGAITNNYLATRSVSATTNSDPATKIAAAAASTLLSSTAFPSDIGKYQLSITLNAYNRSVITDGANLVPSSVIALPIPNNLIDSQSLKYSEDSLRYGYWCRHFVGCRSRKSDSRSTKSWESYIQSKFFANSEFSWCGRFEWCKFNFNRRGGGVESN